MPPLQDVRCLVLGAGGFLGRALSAALCDAGAVVRGFGHPPREGAELDGRVRWFPADFSDASAVARAVEEQELVFHVLGSASPETPGADVTEHVSRSVRLFDACRTAKVRKVVFASSGGAVYGVAPTIPTPETTPTQPISAYGWGTSRSRTISRDIAASTVPSIWCSPRRRVRSCARTVRTTGTDNGR